ncbi:MAG: hypothetical protein Q8P02_01395 [Candidatus Micrarchaeota archaeon]|nr:hypothetical protein [Candidatus Micrarchaeota archaeon]
MELDVLELFGFLVVTYFFWDMFLNRDRIDRKPEFFVRKINWE